MYLLSKLLLKKCSNTPHLVDVFVDGICRHCFGLLDVPALYGRNNQATINHPTYSIAQIWNLSSIAHNWRRMRNGEYANNISMKSLLYRMKYTPH